MIVQPVKCRIAEDQITLAGRGKSTDVRELPFDGRVIATCLGEHFLGTVDAGNNRLIPMLREERRDISRTTTKIIDNGR